MKKQEMKEEVLDANQSPQPQQRYFQRQPVKSANGLWFMMISSWILLQFLIKPVESFRLGWFQGKVFPEPTRSPLFTSISPSSTVLSSSLLLSSSLRSITTQLNAFPNKSIYEKRENPSPKDPNANRPYIQRPKRWDDRVPLSSLQVGQHFKGLIISVRGYGLYIDIGAQADGIVHISDASDKYFVHSLSDRFTAGQEVDCWINVLEPEQNRLRLQLYPYYQKERKEGEDIFHWENCTIGTSFKGKVVKFSDYGAYVDIGAPVLAFLHRHKMKSNRKQRKLQSWEIYPLGTDIDAFVYQMDKEKKRIEITTYPEELWDWRFPRPHEKHQRTEDGDAPDPLGGRDDEDEDEEGGFENPDGKDYSQRKLSAMFGNLEKELQDNEEDSEVLSPQEVQKLTGKRLLIDDFAAQGLEDQESVQQQKLRQRKAKNQEDSLQQEDSEMTTKELFAELTNGHFYLTLNHLKKWYYIRTFLDEEYISNDQLRRLFRDAGGFRGRLTEAQFEDFLDLFKEEMGLREHDEFDEDGNLIPQESNEEDDYDDEDDEDNDEATNDEEEKNRQNADHMMDLIESDINYFGKNFENFVSSNDKLQEESLLQFKQTTTSKSSQTTTIPEKAATSPAAPAVPAAPAGKPILRKVSKRVFSRHSVQEESEAVTEKKVKVHELKQDLPSNTVINLVTPKPTNTVYENILITSFNDLRKRSEGLKLEDVLRWKLTKSMIEDTVVAEDEVKRLFKVYTDGKTMMNFQQFKLFSDQLRVLDLGRTTTSPVKPVVKSVEKKAMTPSFKPSSAPTAAPTAVPQFSSTASRPADYFSSNSVTEEEKDEPFSIRFDSRDSIQTESEELNGEEQVGETSEQDDNYEDDETFFLNVLQESEEKDERELIESMFQGFSNGKPYVKATALLEWDLVYNLIGGGVLTEESFRAKIKQMSNGKPGLDFAGFDQLLTDLLLMYQEPEEEETAKEQAKKVNSKKQSKIEPTTASAAIDTQIIDIVPQEQGDSLQIDESNEESLELNIDDSFEELANGKDFVTPQAIREWDFIKELLESGALSEIDLNRTLASIQPKKKNQFTIHDFALCMDELLILGGFDVEGYEEREFSDYGEPDDEEDSTMDQLLQNIDVDELIGTEILNPDELGADSV